MLAISVVPHRLEVAVRGAFAVVLTIGKPSPEKPSCWIERGDCPGSLSASLGWLGADLWTGRQIEAFTCR